MIYEDLLYLINNKDKEDIQNKYPQNMIYSNDKKCVVEFCEILSRKWIVKTIGSSKFEYEKIIDDTHDIQVMISLLDKYPEMNELDSLIYACFLYFCGILTLVKEGKVKYKLKNFFYLNYQDTEDRDKALFFKFLQIQIDLIDPDSDNIKAFEDLRKCLKCDNHDFIFAAVEKDHDLLNNVIAETSPLREGFRKTRLESLFPKLEQYKRDHQNIIKSLMQSELARLYFFANNMTKFEDNLKLAKEEFPENSFALFQDAYRLISLSKTNPDYIEEAGKMFQKVIDLIKYDVQFNGDKHRGFRYGIEFEAILGAAYVKYKNGLYDLANIEYAKAERIINKQLESDQKYLKCVLYVNRARNNLKKDTPNSNNKAREELMNVIRIYDNADATLKYRLTGIVGIAYNNLGVYYTDEDLFEEANEVFKNALNLDEPNNHARYNLGVLYNKEGDKDRALRFVKNAANIDPKFHEAKEARQKLQKLNDVENKGNLGAKWFEWWFEMLERNKRKDKSTRGTINRYKPLFKFMVVTVLVIFILTSLIMLSWELYLQYSHNILNINGFVIALGIGIAIVMLPFINKLKIGDIEIEIESESAGCRPAGPASATAGLKEVAVGSGVEFLFARYWY